MRAGWPLSLALFALTLASTLYVGAGMANHPIEGLADLAYGAPFALPLLAILVVHEFGHYIAGRIHGVDISPPLFIPMPLALLGTMGAVISMRSRIRSRNALLDVGAAGPLAGLVVAIPVLVIGLMQSPIDPLPAAGSAYLIEGRSLLYTALIWLVKGPIPEGHDVFLSPTAFAGWAGLLVTMINLLPVGQLDGGHVAYALLGERQNVWSKRIRYALPAVAVTISALYLDWSAGLQWLVWSGVLWLMLRNAPEEHPPTDDDTLSRGRSIVALVTLAFFVLLFMPSWIRSA